MSETTTTNDESWREGLTELLESQRASLAKLNELAQQQNEHIREGRTDALLTLLARRQELVDQFLVTHADMQSMLSEVGSQVEQLSEADRRSIRAMIDEINTLLGEVLERDDADRALLEEGRRGIRDEMASMNSGRKARHAYLGNAGDPSSKNRFADQQG